MAKGPRKITNFLRDLQSAGLPDRLDREDRQVQQTAPLERMTDAERDMLYSAAVGNTAQVAPQMSVDELSRRRMRKGGRDHQENDRIIKMTPQVSRAIDIIIASIISPNDLRKDKIKFENDETSLDPVERTKLENLASDFFEEKFSLSTVMSKWIETALYRTGAKVLLTIPAGSLEQEMLSNESISLEQCHTKLDAYSNESLFGINSKTQDDEGVTQIANESFPAALRDAEEVLGTNAPKNLKTLSQGGYTASVKSFLSTEALDITDNPTVLRNAARKTTLSEKQIAKGLDKYRRVREKRRSDRDSNKPFIQLAHSDKDKEGEPLFLEASAESCIPIYVPGSPSDKIGYFFSLDDHGNLARMDPNGPNSENGYGYDEGDKMDFGPIYGAFGFSNASTSRQSNISSTISAIYSRVVETHLTQKVKSAGLQGVNLGSNPAIYRYMFSQYMAKRQVRLIFVPADMVTYFAFEIDEQGCGVSKLEDVKFPLSLRTAAAVGRAMNFVNSSMPTRNISLTTSDQNHGYQLQTLAKLQNADILKRTYSMPISPDAAMGQMAERAYTFKVNGGAGFNWDIENTPSERGNPTIDEEFLREVSNEIILGMGAPPATMNALNEGEYSRSVATTNLVFSATILELQKTVIRYVSEFCCNYMNSSEFMRGEIAKQISSEKDNDSTADEAGTLSPDKIASRENDTRIDDIINSFKITLPAPRIAPDTAQFEHAERITQWVISTIDNLWPDNLAGDDTELKTALDIRKSLAKLQAVKHLLSEIGMSDLEFLNIDHTKRSDVITAMQELSNYAKAVKSQMSALKPNEGDTDDFSSFNAASSVPNTPETDNDAI